jgi:hypothetical protein
MKTGNLKKLLLAIAAVATLVFVAANVVAQDATTAQPAPQLSYGVPQVLQLVQAKVSDGVIVSFIQNSGTLYSLKAGEIVYLKQLGVSDNVLNAMLNQRSRVTGSTDPAASTASAPPASAPAASDQTYAAAAPAAPAVTYVQQAAQPSTVYVIPNTQTYYYSSPYVYPYYGGYYGWPAVSLSFGWGGYYGGGYHGGYYGGWHGGGYYGGGYHGSSGGGGGWHGGGGGHH